MAITSGASPGIIVTSAAVDETIPAQTNVADTTIEVEVADDISTSSNGNLVGSPSYIGRLIILRQGLSNEETRKIIDANASGVGNTWILEVSEPWVVDPVGSTDTIHVSYIIQDAATLTGLSLVNKTVQDYSSGRRFQVGNGTDFAYMAFLDGIGLQLDDNGSTTVGSFTINNNGRFDCGYIINGTPAAGCYLQGANGSDGELAFDVQTGAEWNCYATYITGVNRESTNFDGSTTTKIRFFGVRWSFIINDVLMLAQDMLMDGVTFLSDGGGTTPRILIDNDYDADDSFKNITCVGFEGFENQSTGFDHLTDFRNVQFIDMQRFLTIHQGENWAISNPIWDIDDGTQDQINFPDSPTADDLLELFSLDVAVQELDGTAIAAKVYVVSDNQRGTPTGGGNSLEQQLTADGSGLAAADIEARRFTDNTTDLTVETTNGHAIIVSQYGFIPSMDSAYVAENEDDTSLNKLFGQRRQFSLLDDVFQVETVQADAITLGDTTNSVSWAFQANPATMIYFENGSGVPPSRLDTIGNDSNGAEGRVISIIEGNLTAGVMLMDTRDATAWPTGAHIIDDGASGGSWTADFVVANGVFSFSWIFDTDTLTGQEVYDYFNAKLDEATLDTSPDMRLVLYWANQGVNPLPIVGSSVGASNEFNWVREVNKTEGWMIYDSSGGAFFTVIPLSNYNTFEDDTGKIFTPAATVTLAVLVVEAEDFVTPVEAARVGIHRQDTNAELMNGVTNASGIIQDSSFNYTVDIDVFIRVRDEDNNYVKIPGTITSTGLNVTVALIDDNRYSPT